MTLERVEQTAMPTEVSPAEFEQAVEAAGAKAKILTKIVDDQNLKVKIGPSFHLKAEAWQTLGAAYGCSVTSEVTDYLRDANGNIIGVTAHASVVDINGTVRGGATSICTMDESASKRDMLPSQLAGMAQTRACSRALKQMFSWVVVLAGYDPTPADEMFSVEGTPSKVAVQIQERSDNPVPASDKQLGFISKLIDEKWAGPQFDELMARRFGGATLDSIAMSEASDLIKELQKGPIEVMKEILQEQEGENG